MRQDASREDLVEIIQRGPCFFEIGFQHCKDFSGLPTNGDDFNGFLYALDLSQVARHLSLFIGTVVELHQSDDADL